MFAKIEKKSPKQNPKEKAGPSELGMTPFSGGRVEEELRVLWGRRLARNAVANLPKAFRHDR